MTETRLKHCNRNVMCFRKFREFRVLLRKLGNRCGIGCVRMRRIEAASRLRNTAISVARREGGVGGGSRETFSTLCSSSPSSSSSLSSYGRLSFHRTHSWRTVQ